MKSLARAPFFAMGYRPFFFLGSVFAVILISLWILWYSVLGLPQAFFSAFRWHSHEMIYGFAASIITGFLLTASATWTRTRGLHGGRLIFLTTLWLLARLLLLFAQYFENNWLAIGATLVDLSFLPFVVFFLSSPLLKAGVKRNTAFLLVLFIFWLGNLFYHLEAHDLWHGASIAGMSIGLHIIALLLTIIGGRVIPFFTQNAVPELAVKKNKILESLCVAGTLGVFIFDLFVGPSSLVGLLALGVGSMHLLRLWFWRPGGTLKNPLLWILHLGYFWLAIFYFLLFSSDFLAYSSRVISYHALSIGAMGLLIIGMMSRVSLGHSGRLLILPKPMLFSYIAILLAACVRVGVAFYTPLYLEGLRIAAVLWVLGFIIFLALYTPIFFSARPDGREG